MLNTLVRDILINMHNKQYEKVTQIVSELAEPGVWKDKLILASGKLYNDDYKFIYIKSVEEILRAIDSEYYTYAKEMPTIRKRLDSVIAACKLRCPNAADTELLDNLRVLMNLSPSRCTEDNLLENLGEACYDICKSVTDTYAFSSSYEWGLKDIRANFCQKSQDVVRVDSSEAHLLHEIGKLRFYTGDNIFADWKRYCKLAQVWYLYYDKYQKNGAGESMQRSVLLQAFTKQKADEYIDFLCPRSKEPGPASRVPLFEKYNPNYLFDRIVTNLQDNAIDVRETTLYLLGLAPEIKKSYLRRKVLKALQASLSDDVSEYKEAVKVALQAYASQLRSDKIDVAKLVNAFPPAEEQITK